MKQLETVKLETLIERFETAINKGYQYVAVCVQIEGYEKPEIIINPFVNLENKLAYYKNAYNEDGTLKTNPNIRLVLIGCSNYLDKLTEAITDFLSDKEE